MEPLQCAYNAVLHTVGCGVIPYLWSKTRQDPVFFKGRLGHYVMQSRGGGRPRTWFHASSVGEVAGAVPILHAFHERAPNASIHLTVGTPQGFRFAMKELPAWVSILPFPLDFPWVLRRAFQRIQPDLYVALESEFWPNLSRFLIQEEIPSVLLNGRLSSRSAGWYKKLWPLFRPIFEHFRWLAMHSDEDRRNVLSLGVPPERVLVLGSSKYDGLLARVNPDRIRVWRDVLTISPDVPTVVGGSLRRSECIRLLDIFSALQKIEPRLVGIFAPRHMERVPEMVGWLQQQGMAFQFLSRLEKGEETRHASVVLVDRIGVLFELYALGELIFCGGTFEPIGGHNILEPAAWGKPVFYGPHVEKVYDEHNTLQAFGGSFLAQDGDILLTQWSHWIKNLHELKPHGERAKKALTALGGVAAKQVELIVDGFPARESPGFFNDAKA